MVEARAVSEASGLRQTPRFVYEQVYCARGDIENRIKELHDGQRHFFALNRRSRDPPP